MKRFKFEHEGEMISINMPNLFMLLAAGNTDDHCSKPRVFECKTCNRQFPSFQALGGHRASHKKHRNDGNPGKLELVKPKLHECSVCGLEFAIGQALGGHMRRHRASPEGFSQNDLVEKNFAGRKRALWLDLNLPPLDEVDDGLRLGLALGLEMVDCKH